MVRTATGYSAFVPRPLPPDLSLGPQLIGVLSQADRTLGHLAGVGETLPNPYLLIGPFARREAVLSSRIEGTQASASDLFFFEAAPEGRPRVEDVREVANYVGALRTALDPDRALPVSLRLIRDLHRSLLSDVRGGAATPGEFRTTQNWIGEPGCSLDQAKFVPPPVPEMNEALDAFEKYLHAPSDLPPLIRMALIHYQFEAIHPFVDGNGRIGRLLISLLLCEEKILPSPLLYLSAFFERHRKEYYDHLLAISQRGDWEGWVEFFLRGVADQAADAVRRAARLRELREQYLRKVQTARSSALLVKLIEKLFDRPAVNVAGTARFLGITQRSASLDIGKLVDAGILEEATGRSRGRIFVARDLVRLVEEDLPPEPEQGEAGT